MVKNFFNVAKQFPLKQVCKKKNLRKIFWSKICRGYKIIKTAYPKRMLCVSKYIPNRITYILADTIFFIEDLMTAHNLVPTLQSTRFLEDRRQKSRNVNQGLLNTPAMTSSEWKEAAPPVHPWTIPPDMRNQGIPQPQRRMPMHPLRRTMQNVSHYRVHKKDVDTILLCL